MQRLLSVWTDRGPGGPGGGSRARGDRQDQLPFDGMGVAAYNGPLRLDSPPRGGGSLAWRPSLSLARSGWRVPRFARQLGWEFWALRRRGRAWGRCSLG